MSRRQAGESAVLAHVILGLVLLFAWCDRVGAESTSKANEPPNVLLIISDDLNVDLGCYGHPTVKTPNVDRIAQRGRLFEHAYCQFPLCNPSRTSFLTGLRPQVTGIADNNTHPTEHLPTMRMMPEYFKQAGYEVVGAGKVTHTLFPRPEIFDRCFEVFSTEERDEYDKFEKIEEKRRAKGESGTELAKPPMDYWAVETPEEDFPDGRASRAIAAYLGEPHTKPFFAAVGFHKPHAPWTAPAKYFADYGPDQAVYDPGPDDDLADVPSAALNFGTGVRKRPDFDTKAAIAAYYANIAFMDAQVGIVLDALEKSGAAERTIVVFIGDHGYHLGDHQGLWNKMSLFEKVARAPLIVSVPGMKNPGVHASAVVEFVDLLPTLCDLCGLEGSKDLAGVSLRPALDDPKAVLRDAAVTVIRNPKLMTGRSIRTSRWRYTIWDPEKGEELYDHEGDPQEFKNLAGDASLEQTKTDLREKLDSMTPGNWAEGLPRNLPPRSGQVKPNAAGKKSPEGAGSEHASPKSKL